MIEITLKNRKLNITKLKDFGFKEQNERYSYTADLADEQMELTVTVYKDGRIYTEVTDKNFGEEYTLHQVAEASGPFVGQIRMEYEAILETISDKCFDSEIFKAVQSKEVIDYARDRYGDELEFLWKKSPGNAVLRRKDNRKWYAAVLTVSRRKLGLDSDELVEILDLRIRPEQMEGTVDHINYFPGYHMNKKHWYTICLDGTVQTEEIYRRIDESYALAIK